MQKVKKKFWIFFFRSFWGPWLTVDDALGHYDHREKNRFKIGPKLWILNSKWHISSQWNRPFYHILTGIVSSSPFLQYLAALRANNTRTKLCSTIFGKCLFGYKKAKKKSLLYTIWMRLNHGWHAVLIDNSKARWQNFILIEKKFY